MSTSTLQSVPGDSESAAELMSCTDCDLVGGPFAPAEAAHLRAIHNRLFHGIVSAA